VTAEVEASSSGGRFTHIRARECWGVPDESTGSVNNPVTREEHGVRWNEKWVYLLVDGSRRLVFWHRYDFRGAFREHPDGTVEEEPI
jgi:hypothetical protein